MEPIRDETVERHYAGLLGVDEPWQVTEVRREPEAHRVVIRVAWPARAKAPCPHCGRKGSVHDRLERAWRHLDAMGHEVRLVCAVPRCVCPEHGVVQIRVSWAEPGSRFTAAFEGHAVDVILASRSLQQASELLGLGWDGVHRIMERAVERGLARRSTDGLRYVGLDEKSFLRGQNYISLLSDLKAGRVLEVVQGRDLAQAEALWNSLPEPQREKVEAAAMDMGANFVAATRRAAPKAAIVFDRFHVSKLLGDGVDQVRRTEHRRLLEAGDQILTGTKYLFLQGAAVEGERALRFEEICARNLQTARAWYLKELFVEFWSQPSATAAAAFFEDWLREVKAAALPRMRAVAETLQRHLVGLLSYFAHPITNAVTEGLNSRIQAIKAAARGFRRFANYRSRILFFCGKLDLSVPGCSPRLHSIP